MASAARWICLWPRPCSSRYSARLGPLCRQWLPHPSCALLEGTQAHAPWWRRVYNSPGHLAGWELTSPTTTAVHRQLHLHCPGLGPWCQPVGLQSGFRPFHPLCHHLCSKLEYLVKPMGCLHPPLAPAQGACVHRPQPSPFSGTAFTCDQVFAPTGKPCFAGGWWESELEVGLVPSLSNVCDFKQKLFNAQGTTAWLCHVSGWLFFSGLNLVLAKASVPFPWSLWGCSGQYPP